MGEKESGSQDRKDTGSQGPEGTIPQSEDGISAASTDEASNFEPEEDVVPCPYRPGAGKQQRTGPEGVGPFLFKSCAF